MTPPVTASVIEKPDFTGLRAMYINCTLNLKHCAMNILFSLQHVGFTVAPQSDAGRLGEAGPGPSYLDEGSGGPENDVTNRSIAFTTYNLLHLASMIRRAGGIPAYGNQRTAREAGSHPDNANPEYR